MAVKSPLDELRQMNVAKQREASARQTENDAAPPKDITSNIVSQSYDLPTDRPTDTQTDGHTDKPVTQLTDRLTDTPTDRQASQLVSRPTDVHAHLKALSASSMLPITLKLPTDINGYLDNYIHDHWKEKIKKQDIIKRAMLLAIYELETGKELVKLDV